MLLYNVLNVFNLLSCLEILGLLFYGVSFAMCALSGRNITRLLTIFHLTINFYEELSAPRHDLVTGAWQGLLPLDIWTCYKISQATVLRQGRGCSCWGRSMVKPHYCTGFVLGSGSWLKVERQFLSRTQGCCWDGGAKESFQSSWRIWDLGSEQRGRNSVERCLKSLCVWRSWLEPVAGAHAAYKKVSPHCTLRDRSWSGAETNNLAARSHAEDLYLGLWQPWPQQQNHLGKDH